MATIKLPSLAANHWLEPRPLLAGVLTAFLMCCLLGRLAAERNPYHNFLRFHPLINTTTQFFPTARQVLALMRERIEPERIAVIIGGNSILLGVGQTTTELWTLRLQELLGDQYRVLNLATPSARPWEFGGLAAEVFLQEHPRLIYITGDRVQSYLETRPDGPFYSEFYWDMHAKGLIPSKQSREEMSNRPHPNESQNIARKELRLRLAIDNWVNANDLWTTIGANYLNTVWTYELMRKPWLPRTRHRDVSQVSDPIRIRYSSRRDAFGANEAKRIAPGCDSRPFIQACKTMLPSPMLERTCFLVFRENSRYINRLEKPMREHFDKFCVESVAGLQDAGFSALEIGKLYSEEDYCDWCHLSFEGGSKLAIEVAPEVRKIADRLGYLGSRELK